jgi:hypothetical protein
MVYYEKSLVQIREHVRQASTLNLANARDIVEYLEIHRANIRAHKNDLAPHELRQVATQRIWLILRRILTALRHGNIDSVVVLLRCLWGYTRLMDDFYQG